MLYQKFELMDSLTSHWVIKFDFKLLFTFLVIYVLSYICNAVFLVEYNFTIFVLDIPNGSVLSDSTLVIFDLFDDIESLAITNSMHS